MLHIIANETAGSGAGAKVLKRVTQILNEKGLSYRVSPTSGPGDASRFASLAVENGDTDLICLGGDGTIFEVVNGLQGRFARLYFVPCGTGNDFVKVLDLPKDPVEALAKQLEGTPHRIDVGRVNDHYFLNESGGGFDVEVLKETLRFKKFGKGLVPYLFGLLTSLKSFRPLSVEIEAGGHVKKTDVTVFIVGNGRYIGGGMKAAPHALIDDGYFDVLVADAMNRRTILKLLGKFIPGRHTSLPEVHEWRAKELVIRCPGMTVNLDGELIEMDEAHYELLPGALEIMA